MDVRLADPIVTAALGAEIALFVRPGDIVTLSGDLGAGKTTLARGLIRALMHDPELEVPSPTFSLVQTYKAAGMPILHADLYRLSDPGGTDELGLDEADERGLLIVEWPEHGTLSRLAGPRLDIKLDLGVSGHRATISGNQDWPNRLGRMAAARSFLSRSGYGDWARQSLSGDASARRYEVLTPPEPNTVRQRLLMDSPAMPDPGTGAAPYSRVVHLAEDIVPFLAIAATLNEYGFAAPAIHAADSAEGFAVLEHLGSGSILDGGDPVADRYNAAIDCIVALQVANLPDAAKWEAHRHEMPRFDRGVFHAEAELVLDWYIPHVSGSIADATCRESLTEALDAILDSYPVLSSPLSWVLRDFHSPNIIWRSEEDGTGRVGLIDFQDALLGPAAYDVASLAYDARVDMPNDLTDSLIRAFLEGGAERISGFDPELERIRVAALGAQRNLKILGIFTRLAKRDSKPAYLQHLPRIKRYLHNMLAEPALAPIRSWSNAYLDLEGH
ncbi:MAG: tRNA (adenosine(37)-N6)-threonylcarbamoyltransferase complex ATPase subunit type 1 TsaE [Pseudomonadota bacterium]